jgi:multidrug efflux pump subunit AcrB
VASVGDLANIPLTGAGGGTPQLLGAVGNIVRTSGAAVVSHYNITPVVDVFAGLDGRDLGAVAADVERALAELRPQAPRGTTVVQRGQYATMTTAFAWLGFGLLGAVVLIYLLIVVNFQSWLDPFVIITALPGALAGIVWMLFVTRTTLSVPALIGAIMCMGVATANSILVVSFAKEQMAEGMNAAAAALSAGVTRFRPVLMTALAMIIGMFPMALGLGDGGEQNAPLGRAVIGGLLLATVATLTFVPALFSLMHRERRAGRPATTHTVSGEA